MNKLAALPIRRKAEKERSGYNECFSYSPFDYEVLLRKWPAEPYLNNLAAFSGPMLEGMDPGLTLLQQIYQWTKQLAISSGHSYHKAMKGLRHIFLAPVGSSKGYHSPVVGEEKALQFLAFIIPVTNEDSHVASVFPNNDSRFPQFYCLGQILRDMYSNSISIHPATREMLSLLNKWLIERHHVPNAINQIFHQPVDKQINAFSKNPLHYNRRHGDRLELTSDYQQASEYFENLPVDKYAVNPYYGTSIMPNDKPDLQLVNQYYGMGEPDYYAIRTSPVEWIASVENEEDSALLNQYPLHAAACEGNIAAIRRLIKAGHSPDELDEDGWSPLHYACWYGELDVVVSLIEDCAATVEIRNNDGSTPLHFAAGKGNIKVVEYLLNEMLASPSSLDSEGRSPLAVCLECKENNWRETEQLLRQAYREQLLPTVFDVMSDVGDITQVSASSRIQTTDQPTAAELAGVQEVDGGNDTGNIGSLRNMPREEMKESELTNQVARVSIRYMDGHNALAYFHKGKNTTALEALQEACNLIDLGLEYQFVFALWIVSKNLAVQLGDTDKPMKLLEKWPKLLERFSAQKKNEVVCLEMRRNVFFPSTKEHNITDPKTLESLYYDAKYNVLKGYYSCTEEEAIDLAAITMQLTHGDHNSAIHVPGYLKKQLGTLIPAYHITRKNQDFLERHILAHHEQLTQAGHTSYVLHQNYLKICRKWPYYSSSFYEGKMSVKNYSASSSSLMLLLKSPRQKNTAVRVGINTLGFHIMDKSSNTHIQSYSLEDTKWDMSKEKQLFILENKRLRISVHTKQASLLFSLATQMNAEVIKYKKAAATAAAQQKIRRVRTKS